VARRAQWPWLCAGPWASYTSGFRTALRAYGPVTAGLRLLDGLRVADFLAGSTLVELKTGHIDNNGRPDVAPWDAKIGRWLRGLPSSLRNLNSLTRRLGELIDKLKEIFNGLLGKGDDPGPRRSGRSPSKWDQLSDADLTANRDANIGRPGSGPKVREVRSEQELQEHFDALTRNG
jgi:hypothetical protein